MLLCAYSIGYYVQDRRNLKPEENTQTKTSKNHADRKTTGIRNLAIFQPELAFRPSSRFFLLPKTIFVIYKKVNIIIFIRFY